MKTLLSAAAFILLAGCGRPQAPQPKWADYVPPGELYSVETPGPLDGSQDLVAKDGTVEWRLRTHFAPENTVYAAGFMRVKPGEDPMKNAVRLMSLLLERMKLPVSAPRGVKTGQVGGLPGFEATFPSAIIRVAEAPGIRYAIAVKGGVAKDRDRFFASFKPR